MRTDQDQVEQIVQAFRFEVIDVFFHDLSAVWLSIVLLPNKTRGF